MIPLSGGGLTRWTLPTSWANGSWRGLGAALSGGSLRGGWGAPPGLRIPKKRSKTCSFLTAYKFLQLNASFIGSQGLFTNTFNL